MLPSLLRVGDSLTHKYDCPEFPASDGWVHSFALRGPAAFELQATGVERTFTVTVPSTGSAAWTPGRYACVWTATRAGDRTTIQEGQVEILPDLTAVTTLDTRTHARKVLEAIEATIEGRASSDQQLLTIKGRTIQRIPVQELLVLRDRYRAEVQRQEAGAGIGLSNNKIHVRFVR